TKPTTAGNLTAVVTTNSKTSGAAVQVAAVTPVVTNNTINLTPASTTVTIAGFGFDPVAAHNSVAFSNGAVGAVTTATATSLTVTFSTRLSIGNLTAVVTTNSQSSGAAVQIATVRPTVTTSTANLAASANS